MKILRIITLKKKRIVTPDFLANAVMKSFTKE